MFDIMHELERQTEGRFRYEDLYPISTGHQLCCFTGTYRKERDGTVKSLINPEAKTKGISCCDAQDPLAVIRKDRDFVLNKWDIPETEDCQDDEADCCCGSSEERDSCCCEAIPESECCNTEAMDFDQFLIELKRSMFSVSCMAFQDISNLDAERLKRCRVLVLSPDDRLIPFCAYQSVYRE